MKNPFMQPDTARAKKRRSRQQTAGRKRLLACLMTLVMLVALLPSAAFATDVNANSVGGAQDAIIQGEALNTQGGGTEEGGQDGAPSSPAVPSPAAPSPSATPTAPADNSDNADGAGDKSAGNNIDPGKAADSGSGDTADDSIVTQCTKTEGCALPDGHEGDCKLKEAENKLKAPEAPVYATLDELAAAYSVIDAALDAALEEGSSYDDVIAAINAYIAVYNRLSPDDQAAKFEEMTALEAYLETLKNSLEGEEDSDSSKYADMSWTWTFKIFGDNYYGRDGSRHSVNIYTVNQHLDNSVTHEIGYKFEWDAYAGGSNYKGGWLLVPIVDGQPAELGYGTTTNAYIYERDMSNVVFTWTSPASSHTGNSSHPFHIYLNNYPLRDNEKGIEVTKEYNSATRNGVSISAADIKPGDVIRWKITVKNLSNVTKNITLTENLADAQFESNNTVTVSANNSADVYVTYTVKDTDVGKTVTNSVTASTGKDGEDKTASDKGTKIPDDVKPVYTLTGEGTFNVTKTFVNLPEDKIPQNFAIAYNATYTVDGQEQAETHSGNIALTRNGSTFIGTITIPVWKSNSDQQDVNEQNRYKTVIKLTESNANVEGYTYVFAPVYEADASVSGSTATFVIDGTTIEKDLGLTNTYTAITPTDNGNGIDVTKTRASIKNVAGENVAEGDVKPGDIISWNITVTNLSNVEKTVTLTDKLSNGTILTLSENSVTLAPAGQNGCEQTVTATYTVKDIDKGTTLTNSVTASTGKDGEDRTATDGDGTKIPEATPITYTVTYQYEGTVPVGAPELPATASYASGAKVSVAANPTLTGWIFAGWNVKSPADLSVADGAFTMPSENVVLSGVWKEDKNHNGVPDEDELILTISKVWKDNGSRHPSSIDFQLYIDGIATGRPISLSERGNWVCVIKGLEKGHNYSVAELNVPRGYSVEYINGENKITIINTRQLPYVPGGKLIQTGQLNWPIPVLTLAGLLTMAAGVYLMSLKGKNGRHER